MASPVLSKLVVDAMSFNSRTASVFELGLSSSPVRVLCLHAGSKSLSIVVCREEYDAILFFHLLTLEYTLRAHSNQSSGPRIRGGDEVSSDMVTADNFVAHPSMVVVSG